MPKFLFYILDAEIICYKYKVKEKNLQRVSEQCLKVTLPTNDCGSNCGSNCGSDCGSNFLETARLEALAIGINFEFKLSIFEITYERKVF